MIVPVSELRARFETADRPNQKDFVDLIDTLLTQAAGTVTPEMLAAGGARTMLISNPSNQTLWAALSLATLKSSFVAVATNSGNNYTVDVVPAPSAHTDLDGVPLLVRIPANNTAGGCQFRAHSSLTLAPLVSNTGGALSADDLTANQVVLLTYNSALSKYQILGVLGVASSTTPSGAAGGVLTGTYPNPGMADGAVSTTAKLADAIITKDKLKRIAGNSEAAGKVLGLVTGASGLELSWVDDQNTGGGGGSGGATNYFNLVTTPTVLASGTTTYPTTYTQIPGSTMAAAGVPVGAAFALVEIYLKNADSAFELWAQSAPGAPELLLAKNVTDAGAAGPQGVSVQAMLPLHSDRSIYYKFTWSNTGSGITHNWAIKLIGYYSPGIAAAGTQTTVFLSSQVQLAANLNSGNDGEVTFDLRTPGYVPSSATAAVLFVSSSGNGNELTEGQPVGASNWLSVLDTSPSTGVGAYIRTSTQVVVPLSAAGALKLKRTNAVGGNTVKVVLQGYLLPGTTAATIQTGTAAVPSGYGNVNATEITHGLGYVPPHVRVVLRAISTGQFSNSAPDHPIGTEFEIFSAISGATGSRILVPHVTDNVIKIVRIGGSPICIGTPAGDAEPGINLGAWEVKAYWARVDGVIPGSLSGSALERIYSDQVIRSWPTGTSGTTASPFWLPFYAVTVTSSGGRYRISLDAYCSVGNGYFELRLVRNVGGTINQTTGILSGGTNTYLARTNVLASANNTSSADLLRVEAIDTPPASQVIYAVEAAIAAYVGNDGGGVSFNVQDSPSFLGSTLPRHRNAATLRVVPVL